MIMEPQRILLLLFLAICAASSSSSSVAQGKKGIFTTDDVNIVSGKFYDYIIIGGGTSGCPLAATLSERYSVLIVERGRSPYGDPNIEQRSKYGYPLIETDEFTSVAQEFVSEEGRGNRRGRVLGGSTAINGGFYSRASEEYIKGVGWDEDMVKDAYEWVESKVVTPVDPLSPWNSVVKDALVEAGIQPFNGFSLEHVEGTKIGGSIFDGQGRRHTAADLLRAGNWRRITVLLNATVESILWNSGNGKKPRARGIRFITSQGGNTSDFHEAYLRRGVGPYASSSSSWGDVILSAGAMSSPQILMLSGIGPQEHLRGFNISTLVDASGVGNGMQDCPCVVFQVNFSQSSQQPPDPPQVVGLTDSFRIVIQNVVFPISSNSTRMPIIAKVTNPLSRGVLRLNSTDPRKIPSVRFNYLAEERDLDVCVQMARLLEKVAATDSIYTFLGIRQTSIVGNGMSSTDENLRDFCKSNVGTFYHHHGGCQVGSVVDKDYKVYGVEGTRVVDGSTLYQSPGTNPMATLMMLGRYQGMKILKERQGEPA